MNNLKYIFTIKKCCFIAYKTTKVYDMCWNYCKNVKDMAFVDIKLGHLQEIVDGMGDKWSAKKAFKILWHQMYDYAIKNDMNVKKYSEYIDIGKKTTKLERKPFEEYEIRQVVGKHCQNGIY